MPIYEYKCSECGMEFEKRVSINSTREIECPECSSSRVKKLLSLFLNTKSSTLTSSPAAASCAPTRG